MAEPATNLVQNTTGTTTNAVQGLPPMKEVVVTATRSEKTTDEAPGHVSVVTREQMDQDNVQTLDDALKKESGVFVRRTKGLADAIPSISMRGLYGANRTLVLVDGLPINSGYDGSVYWDDISADNIERMEIIRGPSSALYGGNAMGGVVNLITAKPQKLEIEAKAGFGSYDTLRHSFLAGDRIDDKFWFRVGYEMESTDGYATTPVNRSVTHNTGAAPTLSGGSSTSSTLGVPQWTVGDKGDNSAERWNGNLQLGYDISKTGSIQMGVQWGHYEYAYDRPHTYLTNPAGQEVFSGKVDAGGGNSASVTPSVFVSGSGPGSEDYSISSLGYDEKFGDLTTKARFGFEKRDAWYTTSTATGSQNYDNSRGTYSQSDMRAWVGDWQGSIPVLDDHTLTFGVCFRYDDLTQDGYLVSFYRDPDSRTTKTDLTLGATCSQALYVQDEWKAADRLTVYAGGRLDHWSAFDGQSGTLPHVQSFDEPEKFAFTPKISTVWQALDDTYVRGSIGEGFRAPTIYEMYRTWSSGTTTYHSNPNLKPETLWNFEGGVDQYFCDRKVKASVTYFHSMLDDVVSTYTVGSDSYRENVASAQLDGVEAELSYQPWDWMKLWGNYSYTLSEVLKNDRNPLAEGKQLPNVPAEMANVGLDLGKKWCIWGISSHYTGRIYTTDLNNDTDNVYGGFSKIWLCDTHLTIKPTDRVSLSVHVDNLFDEQYYSYSIGRGRTYFAEVAVKF